MDCRVNNENISNESHAVHQYQNRQKKETWNVLSGGTKVCKRKRTHAIDKWVIQQFDIPISWGLIRIDGYILHGVILTGFFKFAFSNQT